MRSFQPIKQQRNQASKQQEQQQQQQPQAAGRGMFLQKKRPSNKGTPKHSRSRIAQRNVPFGRSVRYPSHASIKRRRLPQAHSLVPVPGRLARLLLLLPSRTSTCISHGRLLSGSVSRQLIACLRESRRDARELLLSTWDGDMSCPLPPSITG